MSASGSAGPRHLALYGSLMASVGGLERLEVADALSYVGPCEIRGRLLDLGAYPGLRPGGGRVSGELYAVADASVLRRLDAFEGYDPGDPVGSLYLRRCMRLVRPDVEAWVYVYNRDAAGSPPVASGDWRRHLASRDRAPRGP